MRHTHDRHSEISQGQQMSFWQRIWAWCVFEGVLLRCVCSADKCEMLTAQCNADILLPCVVVPRGPMHHSSLTWYKLNNRTGIVSKTLKNSEMIYYPYPRPASIGDGGELMLPKVQLNDSGQYECLLRAQVGGMNDNSFVYLHVSECATTETPLGRVSVLGTANVMPTLQALDVPAHWAIIGIVLLNLTKAVLCVMCLWILEKSRKRRASRRRPTEIWGRRS